MLDKLQNIFSNREIAIGIWLILFIVIFAFSKHTIIFLKSVKPILFSRKFIIFYVLFLSYFCSVIYLLCKCKFWSLDLLKDTIFWVFFVELPLFAKTIDEAKNNYFFVKLIKDNITIFVIIEFVLNFWSFNLIVEIIMVPLMVILGGFYALMSSKTNHKILKKFYDRFLLFFGIIAFFNVLFHIFNNLNELLNLTSVKEFLLPVILILFNLPIVYGLALYNIYEQVFITVRGDMSEISKMKLSIMRFSGINFSRIAIIRSNLNYVTLISKTNDDMKINLKKFEGRLSVQVGENYMRRANFYVFWSLLGLLISIIGIVWCNTNILINNYMSLKSTETVTRVREIVTYMCATGVVISVFSLIYSVGMKKAKNEEISQVKKYSLYNFLYLIKRQHELLQDLPPVDAPKDLFLQYVVIAYELKIECDKNIKLYENLLTPWELDTITQLHTTIISFAFSIEIDEEKIKQYTPVNFEAYFEEKKVSSIQNEKINIFINSIETSLKKYSEQIEKCFEEFKLYI